MKKNVLIILGIIVGIVLIVGGGTAFWFYTNHISYQKLTSKINEDYDFDISYETEEDGYNYSGSYSKNNNILTYIDDNIEEQSLKFNLYEAVLNEIPYQKYYNKEKLFKGTFSLSTLKQDKELAKILPSDNDFNCEFEITDTYVSHIECEGDSDFSISFFYED